MLVLNSHNRNLGGAPYRQCNEMTAEADRSCLSQHMERRYGDRSGVPVIERSSYGSKLGSARYPFLGYALNDSETYSTYPSLGEHGALIPGLSDDVAKSCLALVPRMDFPRMSCVSRSWKKLLQSKEFHVIRKKAGTLEEWLYVLTVSPGPGELRWQVLSPDYNRWKLLPPMLGPVKVGFGFVVVDGKLLVIGGSVKDGDRYTETSDVLQYDSALNRWGKVESMHTARSDFACGVLGGYVYVVGGHGQGVKKLSSAEVYDPQRNIWTRLPNLKHARWGCFACGLEGKLFVMGGRSSCTIGNSRFIDVYDPSTGKWQEMKNGCVMVVAHAVVDQKLFCMEWKNDRKLAIYDAVHNAWNNVSVPLTGSMSIGFCLGNLNNKLLLFPTKMEHFYETLIYDPDAIKGSEWKNSAIRTQGTCVCCVTIAA